MKNASKTKLLQNTSISDLNTAVAAYIASVGTAEVVVDYHLAVRDHRYGHLYTILLMVQDADHSTESYASIVLDADKSLSDAQTAIDAFLGGIFASPTTAGEIKMIEYKDRYYSSSVFFAKPTVAITDVSEPGFTELKPDGGVLAYTALKTDSFLSVTADSHNVGITLLSAAAVPGKEISIYAADASNTITVEDPDDKNLVFYGGTDSDPGDDNGVTDPNISTDTYTFSGTGEVVTLVSNGSAWIVKHANFFPVLLDLAA